MPGSRRPSRPSCGSTRNTTRDLMRWPLRRRGVAATAVPIELRYVTDGKDHEYRRLSSMALSNAERQKRYRER